MLDEEAKAELRVEAMRMAGGHGVSGHERIRLAEKIFKFLVDGETPADDDRPF